MVVRYSVDPSVLWFFFFFLVLNLYWAGVQYLPVHFCCSCSLSLYQGPLLATVSFAVCKLGRFSHKSLQIIPPARADVLAEDVYQSSGKVREASTTLSLVQAEDQLATFRVPWVLIWGIWELPNSWALQKQMADRWLQRLTLPLTFRWGLSNSSAILSRWDGLQIVESGAFLPDCLTATTDQSLGLSASGLSTLPPAFQGSLTSLWWPVNFPFVVVPCSWLPRITQFSMIDSL